MIISHINLNQVSQILKKYETDALSIRNQAIVEIHKTNPELSGTEIGKLFPVLWEGNMKPMSKQRVSQILKKYNSGGI